MAVVVGLLMSEGRRHTEIWGTWRVGYSLLWAYCVYLTSPLWPSYPPYPRLWHCSNGGSKSFGGGRKQVTIRSDKTKPREVEIVCPSYQPSSEELEEDMRVNATLDEAVDALTQPVRIRYINRPKPASWASFGIFLYIPIPLMHVAPVKRTCSVWRAGNSRHRGQHRVPPEPRA